MKSRDKPARKTEQPTSGKKSKASPPTSAEKRPYNSVLRQQQSDKTREQIIVSGVELVHEFPSWDWKNLTFRAVSERAGISERTVYRYFSTEQALKDAVIQRLVQESGIDLNTLTLGDFSTLIKSLFQYIQSFAAKTEEMADPTFSSVDMERRAALLRSVEQVTPQWSAAQQQIATATLDIFWQPSTYERLLNGWNLDADNSLAALTWIIDLIENAIRNDQRPEIKPT